MRPAGFTFTTKSDAGLWLDSKRTEHAMGLRAEPARGRIRLEEFAISWLEHRTGISPRKWEIYGHQLRAHVLPLIAAPVPALGGVRLVDLTPELIRQWYGALTVTHGHSIAAKAYVRLRQVLMQAVDDDRIAKNPCRIQRGGVEHRVEQRFATIHELAALAGAVPLGYRTMVLTAGIAGLRIGELIALCRHDVDLDAAIIHVRRKRLRLASGAVIEGAPKSRAGRRSVAIPEQLAGELHIHLERFTGPAPDDYVFTSPDGSPVDRDNFRSRVWVPAREQVGLDDLRFHDLRHTAGTMAARTGATTKELMVRLGHASANASMIYQHATADRDRRIADGLDEMMRAAGVSDPTPDDVRWRSSTVSMFSES